MKLTERETRDSLADVDTLRRAVDAYTALLTARADVMTLDHEVCQLVEEAQDVSDAIGRRVSTHLDVNDAPSSANAH
jgi:hypothetical protein